MTKPDRSSDVVFRFDVFELDPQAGELRKAGARVKLQGQPWQVLLALVEHAGRIVTRDELRERLWPTDTFVDFDHSLNIAVNKIRDALDDAAASRRFIETVPRRGYRFIAPVERTPIQSAAPTDRPDGGSGRFRINWTAVLAGAAVLVLAAGFARRTLVAPSSSPRHTIAVLPIRNLNSEPDTDYFSDGLTDEIIYNLSIIEGLEVRSRASSFAFKGRTVDARDAGKQLKADLLLESTVQRDADKLRLNAALVRVADDVTVWSQQYDRELRDVITVQGDISRAIVNELRLNGIGGQRRYNTSPENYDRYLRALSLSHENAPGNDVRLARAIELLDRLTSDDRGFAPGYAVTARVWASLRNRGRSRESTERMRQAAERAIALDPLLADARASLGIVHASDLRWQDAESDFRRALQLDANSSSTRSDFAVFVLLPEGKTDEGLAQLSKALELDPLSSARRLHLANALLRVDAYEKARALADEVIAGDPSNEFARQILARASMVERRYDDALTILEQLSPASHGYLGYAYAAAGRRHDAETIASEPDPAAARHQLLIYAALGERERCFEALRAMTQADDWAVDYFPGDPELAPLRDDPRMQAFRRQRGLPANH
jgi:TolB-like protein/DNA-binding winged helix-turn-helix (wHTH) protein